MLHKLFDKTVHKKPCKSIVDWPHKKLDNLIIYCDHVNLDKYGVNIMQNKFENCCKINTYLY